MGDSAIAERHDDETLDAAGLYEKGEDCYSEKDYTGAMKWFMKAAEQGHAAAQKRLGDMYFKGKGVREDYTSPWAGIRNQQIRETLMHSTALENSTQQVSGFSGAIAATGELPIRRNLLTRIIPRLFNGTVRPQRMGMRKPIKSWGICSSGGLAL